MRQKKIKTASFKFSDPIFERRYFRIFLKNKNQKLLKEHEKNITQRTFSYQNFPNKKSFSQIARMKFIVKNLQNILFLNKPL